MGAMNAVRIDIAQEHEIETVLALVEELLAELGEEGQEFAAVDRDRLERDVRRNLASSGSWGRFIPLLATDDEGMPLGVLTLSEGFAIYAGGAYGVIDEMYVRPPYRSQGIGTRLVEEAMTIARCRRWFRVDVTAPEGDDEAPAVRFYEKMGFEFTGKKLCRLVRG
jgi:GNAT superfamily N-acetyltransferase